MISALLEAFFAFSKASTIAGTPALHVVCDPNRVGEKDKLTIRAADWKRERFDGSTSPSK